MLSNSIKALRDELRASARAGQSLPPEATTRICVTLSRLEMSARSLELSCPEAGGAAEPLRHLIDRRRSESLQALDDQLADWVPVYDIRALPDRAEGGAA